eukprot:scaffold242180_cov48-Attheya_sp.AAC.2
MSGTAHTTPEVIAAVQPSIDDNIKTNHTQPRFDIKKSAKNIFDNIFMVRGEPEGPLLHADSMPSKAVSNNSFPSNPVQDARNLNQVDDIRDPVENSRNEHMIKTPPTDENVAMIVSEERERESTDGRFCDTVESILPEEKNVHQNQISTGGNVVQDNTQWTSQFDQYTSLREEHKRNAETREDNGERSPSNINNMNSIMGLSEDSDDLIQTHKEETRFFSFPEEDDDPDAKCYWDLPSTTPYRVHPESHLETPKKQNLMIQKVDSSVTDDCLDGGTGKMLQKIMDEVPVFGIASPIQNACGDMPLDLGNKLIEGQAQTAVITNMKERNDWHMIAVSVAASVIKAGGGSQMAESAADCVLAATAEQIGGKDISIVSMAAKIATNILAGGGGEPVATAAATAIMGFITAQPKEQVSPHVTVALDRMDQIHHKPLLAPHDERALALTESQELEQMQVITFVPTKEAPDPDVGNTIQAHPKYNKDADEKLLEYCEKAVTYLPHYYPKRTEEHEAELCALKERECALQEATEAQGEKPLADMANIDMDLFCQHPDDWQFNDLEE